MNRRTFLAATASTGLAGYLSSSNALADEQTGLKMGDVILFQGDSITDAGREKKKPVPNSGLGRGYPSFVSKSLHESYPELKLQVHNRGISGNKVPDLDRRWDRDCLQINPDYLSILIGVNDIWHMLNGRYQGTAETYRDGFDALLKRTRKALPETRLIVCEPFVLMSGTVLQNKDKWFPEFTTRQKFAREVADGNKAVWVPFQEMFDQNVAAGTKPEALAKDGVHPTPHGHQLMAESWRKAVGV